ncbi:MAG: hypothetical protein ABI603_06765 [Acidobacteriota bacterium]
MGTAFWGVIAAAVVSVAAPAPQAATDADSREIASYRLSMAAVTQVAAATRAMVTELKRDPQFQEVAKVDGEIKALEAKPATTDAEDARLETLKARKEELSDALKGPSIGDADSLTEMEAQIRKVPPLMAGLRSANMSPRDYAKFMLASLQAGMVAGLKKQGMLKEIPKGVSVENVQFMEAHEAELQALQKELSALGGDAP